MVLPIKNISQKHKEHPSASGIETGKNVFYSSSTSSSSMWLFVFATNSVHSNTITELVYIHQFEQNIRITSL